MAIISDVRNPSAAKNGLLFLLLTMIVSLTFFLQSGFSQIPATHASRIVSDAEVHNAIMVPDCRISVVNEVSLACERSGVLDSIAVQGRFVQKGDVIARIRDSIAKATYLIAEHESSNDIEIQFARKAGELAQLKYERAQQADRTLTGTVTEFELRELRLDAERTLLQLQQAQHQFAIAQLRKQEQLEQLNSFQIVAPFDGFVRVTQKKPGEFVREGEVVLEIINDTLMRVEGFIDIEHLPSVAIGNDVTIYLKQLQGETVASTGRINFVDAKIEPISNMVRISAHVQNSNSILKDGYLVTMAIAPNRPIPLSTR